LAADDLIGINSVTHVEAAEKDMWEQIGEDMVDVAMFVGPPLIRGAKHLYNRYQKRRLPEFQKLTSSASLRR
jgi:hypothetical protein